MLRWVHGQLVKFPLTRGPQRRLTRHLKQLLGCPDAYSDLANVCHKARPAAILGIPVGFVGAAESKDALAANPHGIPYLIVRGRMGGSAMAAAAVNALARAGL